MLVLGDELSGTVVNPYRNGTDFTVQKEHSLYLGFSETDPFAKGWEVAKVSAGRNRGLA